MIRTLAQTYSRLRISTKLRQLSTAPITVEESSKNEILVTRLVPQSDAVSSENIGKESSVLEKCQEDISHVAPYLKPSFNFAAYVNKSETLQQLVKLGVELYKLEKKAGVAPYVLQLDFERDIKNHVIFLSDLGLSTEDMGKLITKNPFIFKEDLDNLQIRVNYLKYKKFSDEMILKIVQKNPMWLSFSTQDMDKKLGSFQKTFSLSGDEVRLLTVKRPQLITYDVEHIKLNTFVIKEEMGFTPDEVKQILLQTPKLFMKNQHSILKTFEYIHKDMEIPLETIAKVPQILKCREFRIKQRHLFLQKLGKIQFNPKKPNYISLLALVSGSDAHFATEIAGSSIHTFNAFLKTM